jgi:hypothetical protein
MAGYVYAINEYVSLSICRNWTKMAPINDGEMSNLSFTAF